MSLTPEQRTERRALAQRRAKIARASRVGDASRLRDLRRDYAAAKLAAYISEVVAEAPDLTAEQRDRLVLLLNGGDAA